MPTPKVTITKEQRERYKSVISRRVVDKITIRQNNLKREGLDRDAFLRERGIYDEYIELQKTEERAKELRSIIQGALGTCGSVDSAIKAYVDDRMISDPEILDLRKKLRLWEECIILANDLNALEKVLKESNEL